MSGWISSNPNILKFIVCIFSPLIFALFIFPVPGEVEEMEDEDDEEEVAMVTVGTERVPYHEVTDDMVARMTPAQKDAYIRIGKEMYMDMYE